jgi:ABC-type oligopeptide transport system substrate-binding subunit
MIGYLNSSFFTYDYQYDSKGEIVPGGFEVEFAAATKLEDVTSSYVGQYAVPADATDSYAYKITLRKDLKWEDGTEITAEDFVYTMQQQLDPLFKNYRADSFYNGALVINKAKDYVFQGSVENVTARDFHKTWESAKSDTELYFTLSNASGIGSWIAGTYGSYLTSHTAAWVVAALGCEASEAELLSIEGKTWAEISGDATLTAIWEKALKFWKTLPDEELDFFAKEYTYPEVKWEEVGMFVGDNKYEIVLVLDTPLTLLDENGDLTYKAAYNFGGLPLVKKDLYESCKKEPQAGSTLWTTNYNSSVETSASWGAYKLTYFQADKQYVLERNTNWWGYNEKEYEGQYMTDKIVCDQVEDWNSAWLLFQQGKVDSVSIDTTIADEYKYSEQAVFTPDDYVGSLQLQSSYEALKARQEKETGINKTILSYTDFRKALSLGINRTDYNNTCTTASKTGFGLFNSMHYYDVANGGVYRNEDVAKKVLCDVYGVNVDDYASLDEAHQAITGYDVAQARQLVDKAVDAAIAAGDYNGTDKVKLTFGTGSITESTTRSFEYIKNAWVEMVKGTKLEGKLELEIVDKGTAWANDFRAGGYEVCMGGWSGAAWDPGYFLLAYLSPDYMYSTAWDTSSVKMKFEIDPAKEGLEEYSLIEWYDILNGAHDDYNWAAGQVEDKVRLNLIAALEKEILSVYYTVPLQNYYSATLISYKWEYASRDYNTFMGYGGLRYMTYNYTDEEWAQFCADNNYSIDYRE